MTYFPTRRFFVRVELVLLDPVDWTGAPLPDGADLMNGAHDYLHSQAWTGALAGDAHRRLVAADDWSAREGRAALVSAHRFPRSSP
jgi:hypothetical protein